MRQCTDKTLSLYSLCPYEGIFCPKRKKKNQSIQKMITYHDVLAKYFAAIIVFSTNYSKTTKTNQVQYP